MKKRIRVIAAVLSLLIIYCSNKNSVSPSNEDINLETQTIGSEGGEIETDVLFMNVPAGAFDSVQELAVSIAGEDESPYEDNTNTDLYVIDGLPEAYDQPIRLALKYSGILSDESWIAVGEEVYETTLGDITTAYQLYPAEDSSGYLVGMLPACPDPESIYKMSSTRNNQNPVRVKGVTGNPSFKSPHFKVIAPEGDISYASKQRVAQHFEDAYAMIMYNQGFSYKNRTKWPVQIKITDLAKVRPKNPPAGRTLIKKGDYNYFHIEIDDGLVAIEKDVHLGGVCAHEFFHFTQYLYIPRPPIYEQWLNLVNNYLWLNEAVSEWFEGEIEEDVPNGFTSNRFEMLTGIEPVAGSSKNAVQNHGYGLCVLIKYLTEYENLSVLDMYEQIQESCDHPVEVVLANTYYDVSFWLEYFYRKLFESKIYPIDYTEWLSYIGNQSSLTAKIEPGPGRTFSLTNDYQDLSGKFHTITLADQTLEPTAKLNLSASGGSTAGTEITVFEYVDAKAKAIEYGVGTATVNNIKTITDRGSQLFVLVTNSAYDEPYNNTTEITLHGQIAEETVNYSYINFHLYDIPITYKIDYFDPGISDDYVERGVTWVSEQASFKEAGNGLIYGYEINNSKKSVAEITLHFDPEDPNKITEMAVTATDTFTSGEERHIYFVLKDLNLETYYTTATLELEGRAAIQCISSLKHTLKLSDRTEETQGNWYYDSDMESSIKIALY